MLIGLVGLAQSGKDTAAAHLVERGDFVRVAFADPLREMLYALNPIVSFDGFEPVVYPVRLVETVDQCGWDEAKQIPEVRGLLQRLGTEAMRAQDPYFWIRRAGDNIHEARRAGKHVVVTDVRFINEADFIVENGGHIIEVFRGTAGLSGETAKHKSETEMTEWLDNNFAWYLRNEGTVEEFWAVLDTIVAFIEEDEHARLEQDCV